MKLSQEDKVAEKIIALMSDLRLDLEQVGKSIAYLSPWVTVNRILLMAEIAKEEKEDVRREYYNGF
jgi:hypothetical protein